MATGATTPMVGREAELARVEAALDAIESGAPACLAVVGEPGIGKTRLLGEIRARAEERGQPALSGTAAEFERELPYAVVVDALDAYLASHPEAIREDWSDPVADHLAAMFPSLRSGTDAEPKAAAERHLAHRAIRALLEHLAAEAPLIVLLDDVHWADPASVELIASLLRRPPRAGVLLALAFRPGQADDALRSALSPPVVERVELAGLSEAEVGELLAATAGADGSAEIFRAAGGNPFYLEQLARAGASRDAAEGGAPLAFDTQVPARVAIAIADEIGSVSGPARALLDAAAIAGEPFDLDLAGELAGLDTATTMAALDELLRLTLLRPTKVPRRFIFRHPLVRRAVYEATAGGWRLAAHERAAAILTARGASAAERAYHVELSAREGDAGAIELLVEAASETLPRAPAAAARRFAAALRLVPSGDRIRRSELTAARASAESWAGELERARESLLEARELLPASAHLPRAELTASCAQVEHFLGRHEEARRRLSAAWEDLPERRSRAGATLAIELTAGAIHVAEFDTATEVGAEALGIATDVGDPLLIAVAAAALAWAESNLGRVEHALAHRDHALELIAPYSDDELAPTLDVLFYAGWTSHYLDRFEDAIELADRALAIAKRAGVERLLVPLMLAKAHPLEMVGRLAEARASADDAAELARLSANPQYGQWALWEAGWAALLCGDIEAAIACAEESVGAWEESPNVLPASQGEPGWTLGEALLDAGEAERGHEILLEGVGGPEVPLVVPPERPMALWALVRAELILDRLDEAERSADRAEEWAAEIGLSSSHAYASRARAAVLLARGRHRESAEAARGSVEAATAVGARFEAARSTLLAGHALAAGGERERAIETLREAERELDVCGAIRDRDQARRELRALGARSEPRGPAPGVEGGLEALTAREREIADLVTDRRTNREIAEQLVLSEKTIESHLRNIFAKLGVSSRVEVARTVERARRAGSG